MSQSNRTRGGRRSERELNDDRYDRSNDMTMTTYASPPHNRGGGGGGRGGNGNGNGNRGYAYGSSPNYRGGSMLSPNRSPNPSTPNRTTPTRPSSAAAYSNN